MVSIVTSLQKYRLWAIFKKNLIGPAREDEPADLRTFDARQSFWTQRLVPLNKDQNEGYAFTEVFRLKNKISQGASLSLNKWPSLVRAYVSFSLKRWIEMPFNSWGAFFNFCFIKCSRKSTVQAVQTCRPREPVLVSPLGVEVASLDVRYDLPWVDPAPLCAEF